jgi:signal transduction histidine kinase
LFFFAGNRIYASESVSAPQVKIVDLPQINCTDQLSYYVDVSQKLSFDDVRKKIFSTQTDSLKKELKSYVQMANYWVKFSLENTDSIPVIAYIEPGYFGNIKIYQNINENISELTGGAGEKKDFNTPYAEFYTVKITIPAYSSVNYIVRLSSSTYYALGINHVYVLSKDALYQNYYKDYHAEKTTRLLQLLFIGFMFSQMLYVGFSRVIGIKRKEYLFYLFYLLLVTIYYIFNYDEEIGIYWPLKYYPDINIYTKSILLALPYLFYLKFIRYFLNVKELDKKAYKKMIHLEYFIIWYVFIDTVMRFLLDSSFTLNIILMITIFGIFIYGLTIIIPLTKYKSILVNLILTGTIVAGLGGILGLLISLFKVHFGIVKIDLNPILSGQIGIVIEVIIFTTALSYKARKMEIDKIENQNKLITQLEENQKLKEKMEKTRNEIAQDLHDDIGSTLSSILLYSNAAKTKVHFKISEATEIFNKISKISETMMDEMSDIIWAINPMQDSMDKIIKRMNYFASPITNAQNINLDFTYDENIKNAVLSLEKRKNLFLIFKEGITNALKYSKATNIFVHLYKTNSSLHMTIKDNGVGFSADKNQGNGLNNMKVRANDINGQLKIDSRENEGTSIHLIMPL